MLSPDDSTYQAYFLRIWLGSGTPSSPAHVVVEAWLCTQADDCSPGRTGKLRRHVARIIEGVLHHPFQLGRFALRPTCVRVIHG